MLLDQVPGNGESWFVARCFRLLRAEKPEVEGVVSYCDPVERRGDDGQIVMPGHVGTVYQALNAKYRGRGSARTLWVGPAGQFISERALSKLRQGDSGADYAEQQLRSIGAPPRARGENACAWWSRIKSHGCLRSIRHPGNHVYVFGLTASARQRLGAADPGVYPKRQ